MGEKHAYFSKDKDHGKRMTISLLSYETWMHLYLVKYVN